MISNFLLNIIKSLYENNEIYNKFILAIFLIINRRTLKNIIFYININIRVVMKILNNIFKNEYKRREEILINQGLETKIKIDNKKSGLIEMKNEYKNIQNIKERIINRKKKRNNEKIKNIKKIKNYNYLKKNEKDK